MSTAEKPPRVSIVMPARNAAEHIADALRSVVEQTYNDWEAIVVDDGSSDGTASIARAVDSRVQVLENPTPGGPAAARNLAIDHARGELVALLDADDQWLPHYLEHQVSLFDAEQSVDGRVGIVACDAFILERGETYPEPYSTFAGTAQGTTLDRLLAFNPIFISAIVPRSVVLAAGGFEPATFGSADHDLWIRIAEMGYRIVATGERLAVYRKHALNISNDAVAMARTSELVYRRAIARGRLTGRQRRIARRSMRLQRSVRDLEQLLSNPSPRRAPFRQWLLAARGIAGVLGYAVASPGRWPGWLRALANRKAALWRPKWSA